MVVVVAQEEEGGQGRRGSLSSVGPGDAPSWWLRDRFDEATVDRRRGVSIVAWRALEVELAGYRVTAELP